MGRTRKNGSELEKCSSGGKHEGRILIRDLIRQPAIADLKNSQSTALLDDHCGLRLFEKQTTDVFKLVFVFLLEIPPFGQQKVTCLTLLLKIAHFVYQMICFTGHVILGYLTTIHRSGGS